jgi:hypothetical protein
MIGLRTSQVVLAAQAGLPVPQKERPASEGGPYENRRKIKFEASQMKAA